MIAPPQIEGLPTPDTIPAAAALPPRDPLAPPIVWRINSETVTLLEAVGPYPAGTPYSAHDPALLAWVHVTLIATLPRTYELYVGPLTPEERDRYCAEATWLGPLLGIPDDLLPRTAADVDRYI